MIDGTAGITTLLPPERQAAAARLEAAVAEWRDSQGHRLIAPDALLALPGGHTVASDLEWRLRRGDLRLIEGLLRGRSGVRVLDIGAGNGWLSHRLTTLGHHVTATDVFSGPMGLGAPWPIEPGWRRIQVDWANLRALDETFELVVVNRCLHFAADPVGALASALDRVASGGTLIVTGLVVHQRPAVAMSRLAAEQRAFRERFGIELFLDPTKGYLDEADIGALASAGLLVRLDANRRLANIRARFDRGRPTYRLGLTGR